MFCGAKHVACPRTFCPRLTLAPLHPTPPRLLLPLPRSAVKDATGTSVSTYTTHRSLGITAMSCGLFQLTALVFRWGGAGDERSCWGECPLASAC